MSSASAATGLTSATVATASVSFIDGDDQPSTATATANSTAGGENDDDNEPLILNSLAELFAAAQDQTSFVPPANPHKIDENTRLVEADISFRVLSQKDYIEQKPILETQAETEYLQNLQRFLGRTDVFVDPDSEDDGNSENNSRAGNVRNEDDDDENDDDDEALMEILMTAANPGDDEDLMDEESDNHVDYSPEDDNLPDREPRSFILLWKAITEWMTPQSVQWLMSLHRNTRPSNQNHSGANINIADYDSSTNVDADTSWSPIVDQSDIGASRCAGVMAMLRLYLNGCMDELHRPIEMRRKAEKRLAGLLRTFDYTRPNPHLHVDQWKALTCVLLEMVLVDDEEEDTLKQNRIAGVPRSVAVVGIGSDEFRYLSRSSLATFANC
jgi:hypothetical protein